MQSNEQNSVGNKIRTTILVIFITRVGNYIPVPNVDQEYLINILNSTPILRNFYTNENLVLGIFTLGILPYINASIMMQLLTSVVPSLEKLQKEEGEAGSSNKDFNGCIMEPISLENEVAAWNHIEKVVKSTLA